MLTMTSRLRHIGDAIRVVIVIGVAGIVAVRGREWLHYWNIHILPTTYYWMAYTYMGLVVWLATRNLFRNLRAEAKARFASQVVASDLASSNQMRPLGRAFRFPYHLGFLVGVVATYFIFLPLISQHGPQGYLIPLGIASITFLADIYLIRYRVYVSEKTLTVRGFSDKKYALTDINKFEVRTSKNGPIAIAFLANGEILRFSGMLKNFSSLVTILQASVEENKTMTNER